MPAFIAAASSADASQARTAAAARARTTAAACSRCICCSGDSPCDDDDDDDSDANEEEDDGDDDAEDDDLDGEKVSRTVATKLHARMSTQRGISAANADDGDDKDDGANAFAFAGGAANVKDAVVNTCMLKATAVYVRQSNICVKRCVRNIRCARCCEQK
jgi:hypothetical protein